MMATILRAIPKFVIGIIIAGLLTSTIFYRWQSDQKEAKLDNALIAQGSLVAANSRLHITIQRMSDFRKADQMTFAKLLDNQAHIISQSAVTTAAIIKLRATNAQVEKYLSEPVPLPLRKLLNAASCAADCANANYSRQAASDIGGKMRH